MRAGTGRALLPPRTVVHADTWFLRYNSLAEACAAKAYSSRSLYLAKGNGTRQIKARKQWN